MEQTVRRLDLRSSEDQDSFSEDGRRSLYKSWVVWMGKESIKRYYEYPAVCESNLTLLTILNTRLLLETFVLDTKQSVLHGSELMMSPVDIHLVLPLSEEAWYVNSAEDWTDAMSTVEGRPLKFISILKNEWAASPAYQDGKLLNCSKAVLHGMVAVAKEKAKQSDNTLTNKPTQSLEDVADTVRQYLRTLESSTNQNRISATIRSFLWRSCFCMARLAHTLYEITAIDLQTVAGKNPIEGRFRGTSDYLKSKSRIRSWSTQRRSLLGVTCIEFTSFDGQ